MFFQHYPVEIPPLKKKLPGHFSNFSPWQSVASTVDVSFLVWWSQVTSTVTTNRPDRVWNVHWCPIEGASSIDGCQCICGTHSRSCGANSCPNIRVKLHQLSGRQRPPQLIPAIHRPFTRFRARNQIISEGRGGFRASGTLFVKNAARLKSEPPEILPSIIITVSFVISVGDLRVSKKEISRRHGTHFCPLIDFPNYLRVYIYVRTYVCVLGMMDTVSVAIVLRPSCTYVTEHDTAAKSRQRIAKSTEKIDLNARNGKTVFAWQNDGGRSPSFSNYDQ